MAESKKQYRSFLISWIAVLLVTLLLAAAFNYLVDPYGMFDTDRIVGFNDIKPTANNHVRMAKPHLVNSFSPKTVIAGNSRVQRGFDPGNECWPVEQRPVFNLALPGASIYMAARYVQHAIAGNDVRLVLWGIDFLDFLGKHSATSDTRDWPPYRQIFEDRLMVNADGSQNTSYSRKRVQDQFKTLISLDTLWDSLNTLSKQKDKFALTIRRDGFNPAQDYFDIFSWEGQGIIFKQVNSTVAKDFSRKDLTLFEGESRWSHEFESVRRLMLYAREHKVKVILFINPYHADYLVSLDLAGWWPQLESWKQQLTKLSIEFGVELWDFSGITPLSTEQPPELGDKRTILQWFWEPAHYRREYGDLMLSQMLRRNCDPGMIGPVGILLDAENIDTHLSRSRKDFARYKYEHNSAIE